MVPRKRSKDLMKMLNVNLLLVVLKHVRWRVQLKQIRLVKLLHHEILPLEIPMAIVDNTNDLEQLEQLMILLYHKLSITWKPR